MERLRKRSEFLAAAKTGERWVTPAFVVQIYRNPIDGPFRYGITASRKVGGAVERNRAKRRLRALVNHILPDKALPATDYVLIAREDVLRRDFTVMGQELNHAITKLHQRGSL